MHPVARNITQTFSSRVPSTFGDTFSYGKVFYSLLDELSLTVEEFVPGEFQTYVNNDGTCYAPVMFKLYGPEIATSEFTSDTDESYFAASNLSHVSIDNFLRKRTNATSTLN